MESAPCVSEDPYACSAAAVKLRAARECGNPVRIACLDIDSTLTGNRRLADDVRALLERQGFVVAFNTSRTEEMVMTRSAYELTRREVPNFRPPPHLGETDGRRTYVPPEDHEPPGLLDGNIIAGSSGTRILVRQLEGGYLPDLSYERRFGEPAAVWRRTTLALIDKLRQRGARFRLASIDREACYAAGVSDVFPPDYRIQLDFGALEDKVRFVALMKRAPGTPWVSTAEGVSVRSLSVRMTDDSKPDSGAYKLFLTPCKASKAHAAEHIIQRLSQETGIERRCMELFFAGDSFPDLKMGLLGALGTNATFLLVGGSRLVDALTGERETHFAGEGLRAVRSRLVPEGSGGRYRFRVPCGRFGLRRLVIGDKAFPGSQAVETVYRYLSSNLTN